MKYIIAIDQGTTSTRSILFDEQCNVIAVDQMEISLSYSYDEFLNKIGFTWDTIDEDYLIKFFRATNFFK